MATDLRDLLGVGLYSIPEAARLIGVRSDKLRRWAEGYTFPGRRTEGHSEPVIVAQLKSPGDLSVLTFNDLIELHFVSMFRAQGVSMPVIRAAADNARKLFQTTHPFAVERFDTDGKRIFATLTEAARRPSGIPQGRWMSELDKGQIVFERMVRPFLKKLDWDRREARRYWPLGKDRRVVLDPSRAFGHPIDAETGVPTFALYQAFQGQQDEEAVADWYRIDVAAVRDAIEYEQSLLVAA